MSLKQIITAYFSFTRKERLAVLVLVSLLLLVFLAPYFLARQNNPQLHVAADTSWVVAVKRLELNRSEGKEQSFRENFKADRAGSYTRYPKTYTARQQAPLFDFDPNTLSAEGWKKLGLRDKTISIIQNYLSRGGRFRKPEDLSAIYGLFEDEYERLKPYIRIEKKETFAGVPSKNEKSFPPAVEKIRYPVIDINTADTSSFIALPGIGNKLAMRITVFRDKLGGFYSIKQLGETFGLSDSVFQKILPYLRLENPVVKQIHINNVTADELKSHPYIRWHIATAIINYRNEHGPFQKVADLKKVMAVTQEVYDKLAPYLTEQ